MNRKVILFGGRSAVLVCDGRCDKAWGINNRPQLYFQESLAIPRALAPGEQPRDPNDTVYLGDAELGTAPEDPGTYEGGDGKPSAMPLTDPSHMNRWCARECERAAVLEPGEDLVAPNLAQPKPNIPVKQYPSAVLVAAQAVAEAWDAAVVAGDPSAILRSIVLDKLSAAVTGLRKS